MKTVEVKVTVKHGTKRYANYEGEGVTLIKGVTLAHSIRPENMNEVNKLALEGANDKNGYKENPFNFVADCIQNYTEYAGGLRTGLRNRILSQVEGPAKTIESTAKALLNAGLAANIDEARASVITQMKAKGLRTE